MLIEFMLYSIKDRSLFYGKNEVVKDSPFSEKVESTKQISEVAKEYTSDVLNNVVNDLFTDPKIEYKGSFDCITQEIFSVYVKTKEFIVIFEVSTKEDIQLDVKISLNGNDDNDYDLELEDLKVNLKDRLLKDWEKCIWIYDDQSEKLCTELYPEVFRSENYFREFVNKTLIKHYGITWIEQIGLRKYRKVINKSAVAYKKSVPEFNNIESSLLSMTLESMGDLLLKGNIYQDELNLSPDQFKKLEDKLDKGNIDSVKSVIKEFSEIKSNIWADAVEPYWPGSIEEFKIVFHKFMNERNHIAHNKLLSFSAYKMMKRDIENFEDTVNDALENFEKCNPSKEQIVTYEYENKVDEKFAKQMEIENQNMRYLIKDQTGIIIRSSDEIFDLFSDTVSDLCETISNKYYLDGCYNYVQVNFLLYDQESMVCVLINNEKEDEVKIYAEVNIDEGMGEDSFLYIEAYDKDEKIAEAKCTYHNGYVDYDEEGINIPVSGSDYNTTDIDDFEKEIFEYIESS